MGTIVQMVCKDFFFQGVSHVAVAGLEMTILLHLQTSDLSASPHKPGVASFYQHIWFYLCAC